MSNSQTEQFGPQIARMQPRQIGSVDRWLVAKCEAKSDLLNFTNHHVSRSPNRQNDRRGV